MPPLQHEPNLMNTRRSQSSQSHHALRNSSDGLIVARNTLSRRLTARYKGRIPDVVLRRALDDAEELARSTGFPHLFFPVLAEEKLDFVVRSLLPRAESHESLLSAA